jgi:hypothetical protein
MSNLMTSLAFIKANIDSGNSVWDSLVKLMLNTIALYDIKEVSTEIFCKTFKENYNITIPMHPMNTIIGKIKKMGFIEEDYGKWVLNRKIIKEIVVHTETEEKYEQLMKELQRHLQEKFSIEKDLNNVEVLFVGYLNTYDSDLLYSLETKSVLPDVEISDADKYIVSTFIEKLVSEESPFLDVLEDIMLANIHINSIFFVETNRKIKLNRTYVYLDTRLILRLIGIEGEFRKEEYLNLIKILFDNNCNLRIFDVHYKEVMKILEDCINSLESPKKYITKYASRALRHFIENNCSVSDVLVCKASLDDIQKKYKICIDTHDYDSDDLNQYRLDETELAKIIEAMYSENGNHFESQNADEMIWNDVKAISSIYRKRKGSRANQIENVSAILVTSNRTLTKAVREYNKLHNEDQKYSECVTDTYWGTAIWLNTSYKETTFYRKKIIADSVDITRMNPKLKDKYFKHIAEMKKKKELNDTEYYVLKEYSRASEYVKDITFNDDEEYKDSLPEEILEIFKKEITRPLEEIIAQKGTCIDDKERELLIHNDRQERQRNRIDHKAKAASIIAMIFFALIVNTPSIILMFVDFIPNKSIKLVIRIMSLILGILLGFDGFGRIAIGKRIYKWRKDNLLKYWEL